MSEKNEKCSASRAQEALKAAGYTCIVDDGSVWVKTTGDGAGSTRKREGGSCRADDHAPLLTTGIARRRGDGRWNAVRLDGDEAVSEYVGLSDEALADAVAAAGNGERGRKSCGCGGEAGRDLVDRLLDAVFAEAGPDGVDAGGDDGDEREGDERDEEVEDVCEVTVDGTRYYLEPDDVEVIAGAVQRADRVLRGADYLLGDGLDIDLDDLELLVRYAEDIANVLAVCREDDDDEDGGPEQSADSKCQCCCGGAGNGKQS